MTTGTAIDTLLDRTVALGYGSLGLELRRRLPNWPADPPRMDGKVALITGAASGIGLAAAVGFARLGASVRAVGRSESRARDAADQVLRAVPGGEVRPVACDVSSLREIQAMAERLGAEDERLDVLVNNAGVMPDQREHSVDGHELMFATHVLAPFALANLLHDLLARCAPSRVINVSSGGMYGQRLPNDDLESEESEYGSKKLYARTKREEVAITEALGEHLRCSGIVVHAMHPGWVDTKGVREWLPAFRAVTRPVIRSPEQGADTIVWLGAAPEPLQSTGLFWHDRRPRPTHYLFGASDHSARAREMLWSFCRSSLAGALESSGASVRRGSTAGG